MRALLVLKYAGVAERTVIRHVFDTNVTATALLAVKIGVSACPDQVNKATVRTI